MISTLDDGLARRPDDGISNGVVAYHFAGRDELLAEVAREVLAKGVDYVQPRLAEARTGPQWLRTYIEANMAFMAEHRDHVVAIVEIARNAPRWEGARPALTRPC